MTIRQILNRIVQLTELAAQCVAEGARIAAAEYYNLVYLYETELQQAIR